MRGRYNGIEETKVISVRVPIELIEKIDITVKGLQKESSLVGFDRSQFIRLALNTACESAGEMGSAWISKAYLLTSKDKND